MSVRVWDGVERRRAALSFCGKSRGQVVHLVAAPGQDGIYICDGCVARTQAAMSEGEPAQVFAHPKIKPTDPANLRQLSHMLEVVEALRAPEGCPWDREQTHLSLRPYLLEETYEVLEAIEAGSSDDLREELGDVLLQVFMHHAIAQEAGDFSIADVAEHATAKMVHRHPHVFGDVEVAGADEVLSNWEGLKRREDRKQGRLSALEGAPRSLPALAWALSLQKRAARVGFDWKNTEGVLDKVAEEARELAAETASARRRSWVTCCSPWSTSPGTSASTRRTPCAAALGASTSASSRSRTQPGGAAPTSARCPQGSSMTFGRRPNRRPDANRGAAPRGALELGGGHCPNSNAGV